MKLQKSFFHGASAPDGPGPHLTKLHSHTEDTSQSIGLLWTCDQPDAEACTRQDTTPTRDRHTSVYPAGFEHGNPSKRAGANRIATGNDTC